MISSRCFICGCAESVGSGTGYERCTRCGHETLCAGQTQGYIVNAPLSKDDVGSRTGLDRFKDRTLDQFDPVPPADAQWVDIGSASGKYLYQNRSRYAQALGLEITPSAVQFSRDVLGLKVAESIVELPKAIHVATAWHSLEHFPAPALESLLGTLAQACSEKSRLIVSVPNAASRQYRWFGSSYAFFDVPNHLHQFTPDSLDRLMSRFGFRRTAGVTSWPYNTFGYVQGLLNLMTGEHNYLYYRLKRKSRKASVFQDALHILLLPVIGPAGILIGVLDAFSWKSQGVITACYKKDR
jgi:hypothetical protein